MASQLVLAGMVVAATAVGVQAQSVVDTVRLRVEAATAVGQERDGPIWLDPRPELRATVVDSLTFEALRDAGFQVYEEPGIPAVGVGLLSPKTSPSRPGQSELWLRIMYFGSRTGFLNAYSYIYLFPVSCGDGGCLLGEHLVPAHGDGHVSGECWGDFFARTEEEREECYRP